MKRTVAERAKSQPQTLNIPQQPTSSLDRSVDQTVLNAKALSRPSPNGRLTKNEDAVSMSDSSTRVKVEGTVSPPTPPIKERIERAENHVSLKIPLSNKSQLRALRGPQPGNVEESQANEAVASNPQIQDKIERVENSLAVGIVSSNKSQLRTSRGPQNGNDEEIQANDATPSGSLSQDRSVPDDNSSSFYLKHQNKALATELWSLKDSCRSLVEERDARRLHCKEAIQALHSLNATWTMLEKALQNSQATRMSVQSPIDNDDSTNEDFPASTGEDSSVEWTVELHRALKAIGTFRHSTVSTATAPEPINRVQRKRKLEHFDDHVAESVASDVSGVAELQVASNITTRADVLKELILKQLSAKNNIASDELLKKFEEEKTHALLESELTSLELQVAELAAARRIASDRERRLRRNVYRLRHGIMSPDQLFQTLETDERITLEVDFEKQQKARLEELQKENEHLTKLVTENSGIQAMKGVDTDTEMLCFNAQTEGKIADLESEVLMHARSMADLQAILNEKEDRISQLSLKQLSESDIEKIRMIDSTNVKLKQADEKVSQLERELAETRNNWATAMGNEKAALSSIDEMLSTFNKRWKELTSFGNERISPRRVEERSSQGTHLDDDTKDDKDILTMQSVRIIELQHKLEQALENVRQAETTRSNLQEALKMNGTLQSKLKYAASQASRNPSNGSARPVPSSSTVPEVLRNDLSHGSREKDPAPNNVLTERESSTISASKADKLRKEIKRAYEKLERCEKERESLVESNSRLLKQLAEKDEVNARSLSTILHLKAQTDVLSLEKSNLEQQAKTAGQLALAARLASIAKERMNDEVLKEKKLQEEKIEILEKYKSESREEFERSSLELAELRGKIASENSEYSNACKRIDELTSEKAELRECTHRLEIDLRKAEREVQDAKAKIREHTSNAGNSVNYAPGNNKKAVEQLTLQVKSLKSRLACPVCHERDKECIIMRCRHMHCQQCVDDQISSRSRKCPTCNGKFSDKDVESIWLNT